jgi:hypothetical protein
MCFALVPVSGGVGAVESDRLSKTTQLESL